MKLYVPAPAGPWGLVLRLARDSDGLFLTALAFGLRHPPGRPSRAVYQLADRRLSGA